MRRRKNLALLGIALFCLGAAGFAADDEVTQEDVEKLTREINRLKNAIGQFPPEMVQQLMGSLLPYTYKDAYYCENWFMYTSRLRLNMGAPKELDSMPPPILGFPTYDTVGKFALSSIARF